LGDALTVHHALTRNFAGDLQRLGQRRIDVRRYHAGAAQRRRRIAEPLQTLRRDADSLRRRQRTVANGKLGRQAQQNVELEFRTYPRLGEDDEAAFAAAINDKVDGMIIFPSRPQVLRPWIRRASRAHIPVVCVATDAPESGRLGMVAIDTLASGSIAADLMGRFLGPCQGSVAITVFDMAITEHAEKYAAFDDTLQSFYPNLCLLKPIEDHDIEAEAYGKSRELFERFPSLCGIYVTTEASIPVLNAARDAKVLDRLTIITTDLFPDLVPQIKSGTVAATIYQRPRAQGQIAFRMLHEFLAEGTNRSHQVALSPHLLMRGNLDFFLQRQSRESVKEKVQQLREATDELADFA